MRRVILLSLMLAWTPALATKLQLVEAEAHANQTAGPAPLEVAFSARGSFAQPIKPKPGSVQDQDALEYRWDFGDGTTGQGLDVQHIYDTSGFFVAVLTVTTETGQIDVDSIEIRVAVDTEPVVAISANPVSGSAPLMVDFSSTVTGGEAPFTYAWDFGDGGNSPAANPSHTYTIPGMFTITLQVTDNDGDFDVQFLEVAVSD